MPSPERKREVGRGERVLPGIWRLRLPLPWPGVPHCNAWAIASGDGIVMVDCGMHEPGSEAHLDRALAQVNLRVETTRLLVCTHAHADHYGQAATVVDRAGCELWMHPDHSHMSKAVSDPAAALERRIEVARTSGVPAAPLAAWAAAQEGSKYGVARYVAPDRELHTGVEITSDLGPWTVHETPGHAPSHVCLFQPDRRILISGDHVLGRVSLFYDYGYSPDPVGEFLESLNVVDDLDARLCLSGHGRTFTDVGGHIAASRALVAERLDAAERALTDGAATAFDVIPAVFGDQVTPETAGWWLTETLCYLTRLEAVGRVGRLPGDEELPDRWSLT